MPGGGVERLQAPVVEDQKIGAGKVAQDARMAAVAARQGEIFEQSRDALVKDRPIVATRLMAERGCEPTLSDASRTNERQIVVGLDPFAPDKLLEQRAIETAGTSIIHVLDAGLLT